MPKKAGFHNISTWDPRGSQCTMKRKKWALSLTLQVQIKGTETFFNASRKFPEAICSAGSPLGPLIPFNTITHSLFRWMAAASLFKRTGCFALSGFMWHSTATWCALWVAANLQGSCSRARGCVWMEEYLVSVLHVRWNLGGLDKSTDAQYAVWQYASVDF